MTKTEKVLLVGDNPFHGLSHLSQQRARSRGSALSQPSTVAELIESSVRNGANGFMFSVSETTLSVLQRFRHGDNPERFALYAIVPYAYEFVRSAARLGGFSGLGRQLAREIAFGANWRAITLGLVGAAKIDPFILFKAYLAYEIARIRSAAGKSAQLVSLLLHELVTDTALALDIRELFETHISFMSRLKIAPGFETRNLPYLLRKFEEWDIGPEGIVLAAPFNAAGFQMCPSREACEKALEEVAEAEVIAFGILAAGYLKPLEAVEYIASLPHLKGVAVGVSKESHAHEMFKLLREKL